MVQAQAQVQVQTQAQAQEEVLFLNQGTGKILFFSLLFKKYR
jgi:hypothetical protein